MNVVNSGNNFQIYGEDVKTYKELPVMSYEVSFHKMMGFFLTARPDLVANEDKIYGNHSKRVDKVLRSFALTDRNFGVILSGAKGIGKSLFARMLAQKGIETGYPVITVSNYIPGISDFLASIEQEVIVIFDEFEKTFSTPDRESKDPQEEMLSLFDGLNNGKKLFVITCNETRKLNSYLLDRPGRFHYHFNISNPNEEEINEYLKDKLKPEFYHNIEKVVSFSRMVDITYDYLRAIAFELNQGYDLQEVLNDLNITRANKLSYNVSITLNNGEIFSGVCEEIDIYNTEKFWVYAYNFNRTKYLEFSVYTEKISIIEGQLYIPGESITVIDNDGDDDYKSVKASCAFLNKKEKINNKCNLFV